MRTAYTGSPAQTHFIGVLAPDPLAETLSLCRRWIGEQFGCRSGFTTPIHVTLIPPFAMDDPEAVSDMKKAIGLSASNFTGFTARVQGFGCFAERTVFANVVPDERWTLFRDALFDVLSSACPDSFIKDRRAYTPHMTLANRDIPPGAIGPTLQYLHHFGVDETFPVDHLALFERRAGFWKIGQVWGLR